MAINLGSCEIKRYKFYNGIWGTNFGNGFQSGPNGTNNHNGGLLTCKTPTFSDSEGTELQITTTIVSSDYNNVTIYAYLYDSDPSSKTPSGTGSLGGLSYIAYGELNWSGKSFQALDFTVTLTTVNSKIIESNKTYYIWITTNNFVNSIDYNNSISANLYGEKTKEETYTIQYNANGGVGAPGAQTKIKGTNLTLSSTKPTKSNTTSTGYTVTYNINYSGGTNPANTTATNTISYTFSKWTTQQNGGGTSYQPGGTYSKDSEATLYAQYTSTTTKGSVTLPNVGNRLGYRFLGWYNNSSGGNKIGNAGVSYTPNSNITLYAHWEPWEVVRIYTNSGWKLAIPYVYTNEGWKRTAPYVYTSNGWKGCH